MPLNWGITILGIVFVGLMFIATIVGSILFFSGRPRSGVRRVGGSMVMVCGTMLAGLLILATMLTGVRSSVSYQSAAEDMRRAQREAEAIQQRYTTSPVPVPQPPLLARLPDVPLTAEKVEPEANIDAGLKRLPEAENAGQPADAVTPSADQANVTANEPVQPPDWTKIGDHRQGDVRQIVVVSKQYATRAEARNELAELVRSMLAEDSLRVFQTDMSSELRTQSADQLRSLAVKQEYSESSPTDFGSFIAGMYRVWWQVEISPEVRTRLRAIWKERTQEQRTWTVVGALGGITVLLAGLSLFTRRRHVVMG